jgi:hypothetical protein
MGNMITGLTLAEIAVRTRVDVRALRYVLEHATVPFARTTGRGRGTVRRFTDARAFLLALAALFFSSGLRRSITQALITDLYSYFSATNSALDSVMLPLSATAQMSIEIADGLNFRTRRPEKTAAWLQIGTHAPMAEGYRPLAIISVDAAELGKRLFNSR